MDGGEGVLTVSPHGHRFRESGCARQTAYRPNLQDFEDVQIVLQQSI